MAVFPIHEQVLKNYSKLQVYLFLFELLENSVIETEHLIIYIFGKLQGYTTGVGIKKSRPYRLKLTKSIYVKYMKKR